MEEEKWKNIVGFDKYEISTLGNIRHKRHRRVLRYSYPKNGYPQVNVNGRSKCVHSLMTDTFLRARLRGEEIHHKDRDKTNCILSNLEIKSSHVAHLFVHKKVRTILPYKLKKGEIKKMQRIKVEITDQYGSQRKFAQSIGLHETTVSNILSGAMEPSDEQRGLIVKALGLKWNKLIENI